MLWTSFCMSVFASLSYVKRKEPHCISIQLEWRPTGQFGFVFFFWLNSADCFQNNLFFSNSCASGQLHSDEMTVSLYANYCTHCLSISTVCPVTLLMNILDICMNNQTAHRRADGLFVGLECCWDDTAILCTHAKVIHTAVRGSYSGLSLSIHRCPKIGCQSLLVGKGKGMCSCFWLSTGAFIRLSKKTVTP